MALALVIGCGDALDDTTYGTKTATTTVADYVVSSGAGLPGNFASIVSGNGDALKHLGSSFAVVSTGSPSTYNAYGKVVADVTVRWSSPGKQVAVSTGINPPNSGNNDFFFDLQWGHDAVNAPEAWAKGVKGQGVKVAVLDTGFDIFHPDLAPNIDYVNSKSFVPFEGLAYALPDPFSHGTHTAGTIAAADNAFGTIGVAPSAKLILVKVLTDNGSGSFSWILEGVEHAVDSGAQVINMSLGAYLRNSWAQSMNEVVNYARKKGVIIVASAGNDACDLDHIKTCTDEFTGQPFPSGDWRHIPSSLHNVISVSATGPRGWAKDPTVSLDNLAVYSNYGQSQVDFAGPGGEFKFDPSPCTINTGVGPISAPCYAFDFVFSTGNQGWYWSAGTSMAAPHVSGVLALIISEGGKTKPAQVEAELRKRADDLGKKGNDDAYGKGRVSSGY